MGIEVILMPLETLDEQIMIRIPGTLKAKILEKSNQENATLAGTARSLIEEGLASGQKIEEFKEQRNFAVRALNEVLRVNRTSRQQNLKLVQICLYLLENKVDERLTETAKNFLKDLAEVFAADVSEDDINSTRLEKIHMKAEAVEE